MKFDFDKDVGEQLKEAYEQKVEIPEDVSRELCWDTDETLETGEGRWHKHLVAPFKCGDFYYGLKYDRGLTESQENEYYSQIPGKYEKVELKTYTYKEVE